MTPPPLRRVLLLVVAPLLTASCDAARTIREEPPHADGLPRLSYVEEVRIGSLDDPGTGFSRVGGVKVAESGEVYVLDVMAREVRVFNPDGRWLRTVGRSGEGPGEFSAPTSFGLFADTLWVYDLRTQRFSWFGPDGGLLFETPGSGALVDTDGLEESIRVLPSRPRPDGLIESAPMTRGAPTTAFSVPVLRFDRAGEVVDTVRWERIEAARTVRVGDRNLVVPSLRPASPVVREADGDSIVIAWSAPPRGSDGTLEVTRVEPGGDTLYHQRLRYPLRPVPGSLLDSIIGDAVKLAPYLGVSGREIADAMGAAVDLPEFRPPVRTTHVGRDGTIWIELNLASTEEADWLLIGPDGGLLGRLTLPNRMSLEYSDGPVVWVVDPDELDVPWLVRLRVE